MTKMVCKLMPGEKIYTAQDPRAYPGEDNIGIRNVFVLDIPKGVEPDDVLEKLNQTVISPPRYFLPYADLGPGKFITGETMVTSEAAKLAGITPVTLRQSLRTTLPGTRLGRDWHIHKDDFELWLKNRRPAGRPPKGSVLTSLHSLYCIFFIYLSYYRNGFFSG